VAARLPEDDPGAEGAEPARDERREDFDRRKLLASVEKACAKRPVSIDALERLADRIEKRLQETGQAEVASERVGEWTLEELCGVDLMSAARFASVFRGFDSADDYVAFFAAARARRSCPRRRRRPRPRPCARPPAPSRPSRPPRPARPSSPPPPLRGPRRRSSPTSGRGAG